MRRRRLSSLLATLVLLAAFVVPANAQGPGVQQLVPQTPAPSAETGEMTNETPRAYFVELTSLPSTEGTAQGTLNQEKDDFRKGAKDKGMQLKERYSFDTLFNGLSVELSPSQVAVVRRLEGVKGIWPVVPISLPQTFPSGADPELYTALAMTGADAVQSELGYTGRGIKVAVMDTGIDYNHPDLGGCFGPGCRVATGWDFVGDAYDADPSSPNYNPNPVPDNNPDDCGGHGTHVAGIIGANGTVKGVAPEVTFGAYRVFGCDGSTEADIMIAAMERALKDGMQVLNMSIGSSFQWPGYPTALAANRLVKKGMVVVASIGNSGANGLYSAGSPGLGEQVIGVASFDNTNIVAPAFTISPDNKLVGFNPATGAPSVPVSGSVDMARTGTTTSTADGCTALPPGSLAGKVALIRRGTCTFHIKAANAQAAGAAGVVLYNNQPGTLSPTVAGSTAITIPVVAITAANGAVINSRLAAGSVTLTWTTSTVSIPNPTGGLISSFSSYGLSPDLALKPDIGAPGGSIYSTYPLELGGYASLSGTSMSSPHVAGAAALFLQAKPETKAADVRTYLQNTASPKDWWGFPGAGYIDNVHRQGAGMLQIDKAILASATVAPSKLSLGESAGGAVTQKLEIRGNENEGNGNHEGGNEEVIYDLSHLPALATGPNTFSPSFWDAYASVSFSSPSVTVKGDSKTKIDVTITAPADLPDNSMYGGYIVLTPRNGGQTLRVPYAGFKGDYQSITALTPTSFQFPWLASDNGVSYVKQGAGTSYTLANGDIPYVLLHLNHQVSKLLIEVRDAATGKSLGYMSTDELVPRNATSTGFFAFAFDGVTMDKKKAKTVPNGQYLLVVSALKALGNEKNPAHWETWTSPAFTVARP